MEKTMKKIYTLDGDSIEVEFRYDEGCKVWIGDYPDFIESPRYTPNGRPWVEVVADSCAYATNSECRDCSTCDYLKKQDKEDLIGICMNDKLKKQEEANLIEICAGDRLKKQEDADLIGICASENLKTNPNKEANSI